MTIANLLNRSLKTLKRNSPEILTGLGVAGVLSTSYLTAIASFKAKERLWARFNGPDEHGDGQFPSNKEKALEVWRFYIPPAVTGVATIACIIGSTKASGRRTAAAVTAYSLTERAFSEYKDHVIEQLGKGKEQKIRDELAQKKVTENPPNTQVLMLGEGEVLCCELWTGRYFKSDAESLRRAINELNNMVNNSYYATLSDFYDLINLDHTQESDHLGWSTDRLMEVDFSSALSPEGKPCLTFEYKHLQPSDRKLYN